MDVRKRKWQFHTHCRFNGDAHSAYKQLVQANVQPKRFMLLTVASVGRFDRGFFFLATLGKSAHFTNSPLDQLNANGEILKITTNKKMVVSISKWRKRERKNKNENENKHKTKCMCLFMMLHFQENEIHLRCCSS